MSKSLRVFIIINSLILLGIPGFSQTVTFSDGQVQDVSGFSFDAKGARFTVGTESRSIPRDGIRDISFSGKTRESDLLATHAPDLEALREQARALLSKFPDSTSVLALDEAEMIHRTDGTSVTRIRMVNLLVKEEALGIAEVGISFDPNRERVKILHARSLGADNVVVSLSPDQIKVSKGSSGGESYDQNQSITFTIPQVTVGSLVDYSYEIEEYNPFDKNLFQSQFFFQGGEPVVTSVLKVRVPKEKPLYFVSPGCPADKGKPEISEDSGDTVYTWKFSDIAPIVGEPSMPPFRDVVPTVAFCLQKDWTYLFNRLKPMFERRFQLTDAVRKKVDELTADAKSIDEKISRLYTFCQKEIRYISIKANLASNQVGHPAEETLRNRYGDCTDKGMLLATMLKHLGIEAYPVGILTNQAGKAIREIPIFDSNHCITEVHMNGKVFYLDSTATDYRYPYFRSDDHDTHAENPMMGVLSKVPQPPPEDNSLKVKREMTMRPDGTIDINFESEMNGGGEASLRGTTRNMKPAEYERTMKSIISAITPDYKLDLATHSDPLDFSGPFNTRSVYTLNHFGSRSGSYLIFEIPLFRLSFPEVSLAKRKYDIRYLTTSLRTDDIRINLPPNFRVKYLPSPLKLATPYIEFDSSYVPEGSRIIVKRRLAVLQRNVPVSDYLVHRESLEKIAKFTEERIFLEEIPATGDQTK